MASAGVDAEAGGTAIQKVLIEMTRAVAEGGDKLGVFAQVAGLSAEEFRQAFQADAAGAFTAFVEGLGSAGDQAFGVLEALDLLQPELRELGKSFKPPRNCSADRRFGTRQRSLASQPRQFFGQSKMGS